MARKLGFATTSVLAVGFTALATVIAPSAAAAAPSVRHEPTAGQEVQCANHNVSAAAPMDYCQGYWMYDTLDECEEQGFLGVFFGDYDYYYCEWVPIFNRWQVIGCVEQDRAAVVRAGRPV